MIGAKTLRYAKTRRVQGRRAITPIKPKRKRILKTRYRKKVENGVSIQQHTGSRGDGKWKTENEKEYRGDCEWEGNKDSRSDGERKDAQEHQEAVQCGNEEDSAESVYPGSLQELHRLPELAVADITNETELKEEEGL